MKIYAYKELETFPKNLWYYQAKQHLLQEIIENNKFHYILDIGCGNGFNYGILSKKGIVFNLDYNVEALKYCKVKNVPNLVQGNAEKLPFKDESFDLITIIEVMEHLDNDKIFMKKVYNLLKKKGKVILTVPAHKWLWGEDDERMMHKRRYGKKDIERIVTNAGFKINYIGYRYFFIFPSALLLKIRNKKRNSLAFTPKIFNNILTKIMKAENILIKKGFKLPLGIGLLAIIEK